MIKFRLLIAGSFIFLIASGQSAKTPTTTAKKNNNTVSSKFGKWEQDEQGNKYGEDYALRDLLRGSELVKYTRINGGQYGGGSSTTKFTLCSDGSLKYYHQSLTTVSVDGAGGSNASKEEDEGTWQAIENEKGLKLIILRSAKYNTTGYMEVKPMCSKVHLVWFNE